MVHRTIPEAVRLEASSSNNSAIMEENPKSQWSSDALEKAASTLKALNRMAKRPPVNILFEDISYTITSTKGERKILHNISGEFQAGELTCVLGPSGAGKSTLLNILAGYTSNGVTGRIKVNGHPRDMRVYKKLSTYIMQDDLMQPRLTVFEAMRIAADLKLGKELSKVEKELIMKEILETLGLWSHRDTMTETLSGGELKRLSIAVELVNNPPVIFLDEPTTGLDVVAVRQLVILLRLLSGQGRTIICTIHQPSATLFGLFDKIYVLAKGMCCYQGSPQLLVPHLALAGYICPTNHNPADFVMETLQSEDNSPAIMSELCQNGKTCRNNNKTPVEERYFVFHAEESMENIFVEHVGREQIHKLEFPTTFWTQFFILSKRMFVQNSRNKTGIVLQLGYTLGAALLIGGLFYGIGNNALMSIVNFKFCLSCLVFVLYTHIIIPVLVFPMQVQLLRREYFNRWYSLKAYYAALTFSTLPLMTILWILFVAIVYPMSGQLLEWDRILMFALNGLMAAVCSEGFGLAIGATFSDTNGCIIAPALSSPLLVLSCYGIGYGTTIESVMKVIMSMSYMRYGATGFTVALYQNRGEMDCPDVMCLYANPKQFLRDIGMGFDSYWVQIAALFGFAVLHRFLAYLALRYRLTVEFSSKFMTYVGKALKHR